jgi:DNA polymerase-4
MKRILCVDMDAFFASAEQAIDPSLRGKPVIVIGKKIIIAASYEARKFGVRVGLNVYEGKRMCPEIRVVNANHDTYLEFSRRIAEYLRSITPSAVMYSIDEAFLDVTDIEESSAALSGRIRKWFRDNLKITGSVGIGPTYVTAKMATKVMKPDGHFEITERERIYFMDRFPLREVWGIGGRTEAALKSRGLFSLADVRRCGEDELRRIYGDIRGSTLFRLASGLDTENPIGNPNADHKSISRSATTGTSVSDVNIALACLLQLSEAVSAGARHRLYSGRTVKLYVRNALWEGFSYRKNLNFYTSATHHIYEAIKALFLEHVNTDIPLRIFGVTLEDLRHGGAVLANLEDYMNGEDEKYIKLYGVIDKINSRARNGIKRGATLTIPKYEKVQPDSI